jgi:tetratricopeptide (TPR) repeat protein
VNQPDFGVRSEFYTFAPEALASELPDFEILREVGKGSMGIVYEARRKRDGLRVALKVLPPSLTLTERALARFLREGEVMAKVEHPAIVRVLEHGRQGRLHYFVMEFVEGATLEQRLRIGPLPVQQAAQIAAETARALHFAHEHGIVHRDVKPGNLMLRDDGRIAITDFGLARETGTGAMTESGAIVGTPMYMAPEQVLGERGQVGTRSDVYGLGATLYHLVTGRPPFEGPTAQSVLKAVLEHDPPRPSRLRPDLSPALEAITRKAMEKEPFRRYGSALELAEDLEHYLRGERVQARLPSPARLAAREVAKHPLLAVLVLVALVLAFGTAVFWRESRVRAIEANLAAAEWAMAQASLLRDDRSQPRTPKERRQLLNEAIASGYAALALDSSYSRSWFVLSKAHHRLQQWREALHDLDEAERCLGRSSPEILHFRIDTLQQMSDPDSQRRLRSDLVELLTIDPGVHARCLLAEHLLELGSASSGEQRTALFSAAERLLRDNIEPDPRTAVAQADLLWLRGDRRGAERAIRQASREFQGNPLVHSRAAALLVRLGLSEEGAIEASLARMLTPETESAPGPQPTSPVDEPAADEIARFLVILEPMLPPLPLPVGEPVLGKD